MPKLKTHKGLQKRVKISPRGVVKRKRAGGGHLMSEKSGKRKRKIRRRALAVGAAAKKIRIALGRA